MTLPVELLSHLLLKHSARLNASWPELHWKALNWQPSLEMLSRNRRWALAWLQTTLEFTWPSTRERRNYYTHSFNSDHCMKENKTEFLVDQTLINLNFTLLQNSEKSHLAKQVGNFQFRDVCIISLPASPHLTVDSKANVKLKHLVPTWKVSHTSLRVKIFFGVGIFLESTGLHRSALTTFLWKTYLFWDFLNPGVPLVKSF